MFKRLVKSSLKRVGLKLVRVTSEDTNSLQRTDYHAHYRGREFLCYKNGAISEKLLLCLIENRRRRFRIVGITWWPGFIAPSSAQRVYRV